MLVLYAELQLLSHLALSQPLDDTTSHLLNRCGYMLPSFYIPVRVVTCFLTKELQKEHSTGVAFTTIHFDEFCILCIYT